LEQFLAAPFPRRRARLRQSPVQAPLRLEEDFMFSLQDLFQWDRFITPSIIQLFYWLVLLIVALVGLSSIAAAVGLMKVSLLHGTVALIASLIGMAVGVLLARIAAEFVLIVFRMNEHLGAIRNRDGL
jgi:hypothetical protein